MRKIGYSGITLFTVFVASLSLGEGVQSAESHVIKKLKTAEIPHYLEVIIDCNRGDSINDALSDSIPGGWRVMTGWRVITVNGTCDEDVSIFRSRVVLQGGIDGKIVGQVAGNAAIEVHAVNNVIIQNITIANGAGTGVRVKDGASVKLRNAVVENHQNYEVWVQTGAVLRLYGNTISSIVDNKGALHVGDGSVARIEGNNSFSSAGTFDGTITAIRGSTMRMVDGNTSVENTGPNGTAVSVTLGSTFRQDKGGATIGHVTVKGNIEVFNVSNAEFRDVAITGDVGVGTFSSLIFREQSDDPTNVTVTGTTNSWGGGHIRFKSDPNPPRLNGDLNCSGGTSSGTPVFLGGHNSNC